MLQTQEKLKTAEVWNFNNL